MAKTPLTRDALIPAGACLALGALAGALLLGRRGGARFTARVASAFLMEWSDLRLEKRVARLLSRAEAEGLGPADLGDELAETWRRP